LSKLSRSENVSLRAFSLEVASHVLIEYWAWGSTESMAIDSQQTRLVGPRAMIEIVLTRCDDVASSVRLRALSALFDMLQVLFHVLSHLLLIYICKLHWNLNTLFDMLQVLFHVLSHLLLIYICKLHWNLNTLFDMLQEVSDNSLPALSSCLLQFAIGDVLLSSTDVLLSTADNVFSPDKENPPPVKRKTVSIVDILRLR
jgi:hypothetical protein